jgi:hypothetical protein
MNGGPATAGVADTRAAAVTAAATSERLSNIANSLDAGGESATVRSLPRMTAPQGGRKREVTVRSLEISGI